MSIVKVRGILDQEPADPQNKRKTGRFFIKDQSASPSEGITYVFDQTAELEALRGKLVQATARRCPNRIRPVNYTEAKHVRALKA